MSISIPWENERLENILRRGGSQIAKIFQPVQTAFGYLIGENTGTTELGGPNGQIDDQPKSIKTSWGEELGYLVHMNFFPKRYFPPHIIDFIDYSDTRNKAIHLRNYRKMGGVYDNHPLDMLRLHFGIVEKIAPEIARITGKKIDDVVGELLDYRGIVSKKRHDDFEDDKDVNGPAVEFKTNLKAAIRVDPDLTRETPEYKKMMKWRDTVKEARGKVIDREHSMQIDALNDIATRYHLPDAEKAKLILGGDVAIGVMDWDARHTEENFFTTSMFRANQIYNVSDYIQHQRGGPFQEYLMKQLKVQDIEPLFYVLMRIYDRLLDRTSNSMERKPRYPDKKGIWASNPKVDELEDLFKQNAWLRETFGDNIVFRVEHEMSRPDRMEELYKNHVVLSNVYRLMSSKYIQSAIKNPARYMSAYSYLLAIDEAIGQLIKVSRDIISELASSYKRELGSDAEEIEARVDSMPPYQFKIITGHGPISNGHGYETGLDVNVERKGSDVQLIHNYEDILSYARLMDNFASTHPVVATLRDGHKPFVIGGLGEGISFHRRPTPFKRTI